MKLLLALITVCLFSGCSSTPRLKGSDYFSRLKALPIGSTQPVVMNQLGKPTFTESDEDGTKWTYEIPYEGQTITKAIVWFDHKKNLRSKFINLFEEDKIILSDVPRTLGKLNFVVEPRNLKSHYVSPVRTLVDKQAGTTIQVNEARNNELESIFWYTPGTDREIVWRKATSEKSTDARH